MPVYIDARPPGLDLTFLRGTARNQPILFPAGTLAGRTFTATLDGVGLSVGIVADTLTVSITVAQTNAAAAGALPFVLTETTGVDQPYIVGTWRASTRPSTVTPSQTFTLVVNNETVTLQPISGTEFPEIASSDPAKMPVTTANGVTTLGVEKLAPEIAYLLADSANVNNSTTLVDVTGLLVPVAANAVYWVAADVFYTSTTVADLLIGWTVPAGVSGLWMHHGLDTTQGGLGGTTNHGSSAWTANRPVGGSAGTPASLIRGTLITASTSGSLQMRFAQNTAEATNTNIKAGTILRAERVG